MSTISFLFFPEDHDENQRSKTYTICHPDFDANTKIILSKEPIREDQIKLKQGSKLYFISFFLFFNSSSYFLFAFFIVFHQHQPKSYPQHFCKYSFKFYETWVLWDLKTSYTLLLFRSYYNTLIFIDGF